MKQTESTYIFLHFILEMIRLYKVMTETLWLREILTFLWAKKHSSQMFSWQLYFFKFLFLAGDSIKSSSFLLVGVLNDIDVGRNQNQLSVIKKLPKSRACLGKVLIIKSAYLFHEARSTDF